MPSNTSPSRQRHLQTRCLHAGELRPGIAGAVNTPIFQTAVFEHRGGGSYHDIVYPRLNNLPNHKVLGERLADLEGGEMAVVTGSGMAAITTSLLTVLGKDGHMLVQDSLYGGTHAFVVHDLEQWGLGYTFVDGADPASWRSCLRANTRAFYTESVTNPLLRVADHEAVVAFAREHGLTTLIDNTFATPVNFRPLEIGYDVALHSATKYLNGHSDLAAGAIAGSRKAVEPILHKLNHLGGMLDPHACFLLERGMKTLALRMAAHNDNAARLARFLAEREEVAAVHYPGLADHPHHERARALFDGFGGMLSFEPKGGLRAANALMEALDLAFQGPSLGGVETLVSRPAALSHSGLSPEERAAVGIADGLIRVSVGIEHIDDLLADFEEALESL